jgi:hypothetical protein
MILTTFLVGAALAIRIAIHIHNQKNWMVYGLSIREMDKRLKGIKEWEKRNNGIKGKRKRYYT